MDVQKGIKNDFRNEFEELKNQFNSLKETYDHTIHEKKQLTETLMESEERFRGMFQHSVSGMGIISPDYRFVQINESFCKMLDYSENELLLKTFQDITYPEDLPLGGKMVPKVLAGEIESFQLEKRYVRKNGGVMWGLVTTTLIRDMQNKPFYFVSQVIDISERKRMETILIENNKEFVSQNQHIKQINKELLLAKEKAEQSDRLKTAFLQNMSHEIRTPMNAIMGFSNLLVNQYNNKPKLEFYSSIIHQRCSDLLELMNDLLDIAKIESGELPVHVDECQIQILFNELSLFFQANQQKIAKQNIQLTFTIDDESTLAIVTTDKVKLKQILINLIGNALKFTEEGQIIVGCKLNENNGFQFFVKDTGIGIPSDKHEQIFDRFIQLNLPSSHKYGGTGLGLSIVKGLVTLLGGEIWLESSPGVGSTFYFSIPQTISTPE